eukprot:Skav229350  [mRNA]  locus=scaffold2596:516442:516999:- [translate_table: standard]
MAGALKIERQVTIQFKGGKKVTIPSQLLEEACGKTWLRLRPASTHMCALLCSSDHLLGKNPSLSGGGHLGKLIELRQQAYEKKYAPDTGEKMFEDEEEEGALKKKRCAEPEILSVEILNTNINVLAHPKRTLGRGIQVELEESQLAAVLRFLKPDCCQLFQGRPPKEPKKKQPKAEVERPESQDL